MKNLLESINADLYDTVELVLKLFTHLEMEKKSKRRKKKVFPAKLAKTLGSYSSPCLFHTDRSSMVIQFVNSAKQLLILTVPVRKLCCTLFVAKIWCPFCVS